jgi:hypothetical protein
MFSNGTKMIYGDFIGLNGFDVNVFLMSHHAFHYQLFTKRKESMSGVGAR